MNAPTIRIRVVHAVPAAPGERFGCDEIVLGPVGPLRAGPVDLLLIDARAMPPPVLAAALGRVAEWQGEGGIHQAVLVWPKPTLEGVVLALRAGVRDLVPTGWAAARVVRRLGGCVPVAQRRLLVRRLVALLRLGRAPEQSGRAGRGRSPEAEHAAFLADEQRAAFDQRLAEREAALAQREQELHATAKRVQTDLARASQACSFIELAAELRAELERRETELQLMAQQVATAPAAPMGDGEGKTAFRTEMARLLETQQLSLDLRERALATRERWLQDYEQALTGGRVSDRVN